MIATTQLRACDVCRLIDHDMTPKLCGYCGFCDAWICVEDNNDWIRRMRAAVKRVTEPDYRGDPEYVTKMQRLQEVATKNESHPDS